MDIKVTKASGAVETLNLDKLRSSLTRSGADKLQADEIIERMLKVIEPATSTKKIYRLARKYLRQFNHASGIRYSLKRALQRLGPSGYPFEKYFGAILENYAEKVPCSARKKLKKLYKSARGGIIAGCIKKH